MILVPYFETIISNTCVVRYAYICADVAIIEDYCYARCLPVSPAAPYYRCSQQTGAAQLRQHPPRRSSAARQHSLARQHFRGNGYRSSVYLADKGHCQPFSFLRSSSLWSCSFRILIIRGRRRGGTSRVASRRVAVSLRPRANHTAWCRR